MNPYRQYLRSEKTDWAPAWLRHLAHRGRSALPTGVLVVIFVALVAALSGCGDMGRLIQARTADGVATAANSGLPILVERYNQEGIDAIMAVKKSGGTKEQAHAAIAKVKAKWDPVWKAWETLRVAQDAWAGALESGGDTSAALGQLKGAYCGLSAVWPDDIPAVPLAPMKCPDPAVVPASSVAPAVAPPSTAPVVPLPAPAPAAPAAPPAPSASPVAATVAA